MYLLDGEKWRDGFLDYHRPSGCLRIEVQVWALIGSVREMYVQYPRDWNLIREYVAEFGWRAVLHKIRSRLGERLRNNKFVSVGLGRVIETGRPNDLPEGTRVIFLAPAHPRCVERIVLPPELVRKAEPRGGDAAEIRSGIRFYQEGPEIPGLEEIGGWQPDSGLPLPEEAVRRVMELGPEFFPDPPGSVRILPISHPSPVAISAPAAGKSEKMTGRTAVLYGLGNYAKSHIIPNLDPAVRLRRIHEIDPTQIGGAYAERYDISTRPDSKDDPEYDIHIIAGYHHTHAGLAVRALEAGATAVVEKPVVTTREQLSKLMKTLRENKGRLFISFQMRYNPLFSMARRDLNLKKGEAVHITADVYEIPVPPRHWYRWPVSGSHLISNGCHWLDHFLFMNEFSRPVRSSVERASNGDTSITVELKNGACLFLHLTHIGSPRIGVQERVAMRRGDRTVTVVNSSRYLAEVRMKKLRKTEMNKMEVYRLMYREISRKILAGEPGDSPESVETSASLMLGLEEQLQRQLADK